MSVKRSSTWQSLLELLSSMRFAISLLSIISIAAIIGTVLKQNEANVDYIVEFGPFWFDVFRRLGLQDVYHAAWFLLILAFLVTSTSLCLWRNTPRMLNEMRSFRQKATEASLRSFAHRAEFALPPGFAAERLEGWLKGAGWQWRRDVRDGGQVLYAAKRGSGHRIGYILTHAAIVIICLGGLLDGNIPLELRQLLGQKHVETRDMPQSQVPAISRLSPGNLAFRGNVTIPEGSSANIIFLDVGNGYYVQDLPFSVALKKFRVEYYSTGQPRLFASDVVLTDKKTGRSEQATISVNHPLHFDGVAIYQASFGDGGSHLTFRGWNLDGSATPFNLSGTVKQAEPLHIGNADWRLELDDFRQFNVEDFGKQGGMHDLRDVLRADQTNDKELRNIGPSVQYKLRDASGQAHEYLNYLWPVMLDGHAYMVSGVRSEPNAPFQFVRMPLDANGRIDEFMALRALLLDPAKRQAIARRFAATTHADPRINDAMRARLVLATSDLLQVFASGGYDALDRFIRSTVPKAQQEQMAATYLRLLDGATAGAWAMLRESEHQPAPPATAASEQFLRDTLVAMSDLDNYGAPVYLQPVSFVPVLATGLQMTRAPGQNVVYLGSLLLVLGVLAMFYVRERRLWLLCKPAEGTLLLAVSGNRKTLDLDHDFARVRDEVDQLLKG